MEATLKVKPKTYKLVKAIAEDSGLSLGEVADTLINEGIEGAKDFGKVSEKKLNLDDLRAEVDGVKNHNRRLQAKVDELTEEVQGEGAIESAEVVGLTKDDLLGRKPKFRKENNVVARCDACGEVLDDEEKPEHCPGCGMKLDWDSQGAKTGAGAGWVIAGVIALALLNRRAQAGL